MVDPTVPPRPELERIAGSNHRLVIALERLFKVAGETLPDAAADTALAASQALAQASKLAGQISELADEISLRSVRVEQTEDALAPKVVGLLQTLGDVDLTGAVTGDVLSYDGDKWVPVTGATGTFLSSDAKTITVTNGIITNIV